MDKMVRRIRSVAFACLLLAVVLAGCSGNSGNSGNGGSGSDDGGSGVQTGTDGAAVADDRNGGKQGEQGEQGGQQAATESGNGSEEAGAGIQPDPNKKVKLRYYTPSGYDKVEFDAAYPEWQKLYPNIEVELVLISTGDFTTSVKMATIAGEQIDIIYTGTDSLERANPDSLYIPLDDLVRRDGWDLAAEFGQYTDQLSVDGKLYGIPRAKAPDGIWYNKAHFAEIGVPEPVSGDWTWKQFFEIARQLTKVDGNGNVIRYGFHDWNFDTNFLHVVATNLALYGGWEMVKEDGSFNTDWTLFQEAVQLLYDAVYVDRSLPSPADIAAKGLHWQNDYLKGVFSMSIAGSNGALFQDIAVEYGQLTKEEDDKGIHTLAPMPRWDVNSPRKQTIEIIQADSISKLSRHPEEAYLFVKWHATKSVELASKVAHRVPASKLLDQDALKENWRYYNNKNGELVLGKERDELYSRMMDPDIIPIYAEHSVKYSYTAKMKLELEKHLSLLFANETTVDSMVEQAKLAAFKIYEEESGK